MLEPPSYEPGSWRGAGRVLVDYDTGEFWLTTRPRERPPKRGYAFEIYRSRDGENFSLVTSMSKEELSEATGLKILSIEGQQLLRDPSTGMYHLYLSIDNEGWPRGGWDTLLMVADDPRGPWKPYGLVIRRELPFETAEARDATIDIVDGRYVAIYKANSGGRVAMALAVSSDGKEWRKLGLLRVDGYEPPNYMLLYGRILEGAQGPVFIGGETLHVVGGAAVTNTLAAYLVDLRERNLELLSHGRWTPMSPYERSDYPIHSYVDVVYDPFKDRILVYIDAIDSKSRLELNQEINRVLLYEVPLSQR